MGQIACPCLSLRIPDARFQGQLQLRVSRCADTWQSWQCLVLALGTRGMCSQLTARTWVACLACLLLSASAIGLHSLPHGVAMLETRAQWLRYRKRLSRVHINDRPISPLLKLLQHDFSLSRSQVDRGLAFTGSQTRLRHFSKKLTSSAGQPMNVSIGVVGGHITCSSGHDDNNQTCINMVAQALTKAYPNVNIKVVDTCNQGMGYEVSEAELCVPYDLPTPPDLLIIEQTSVCHLTNDFMHNQYSKTLERMIRRALLPKDGHESAILMVHLVRADQVMPTKPADSTGNTTHTATPQPPRYIHTYEEMMCATAQYYDIPWLSLRDAIWHDVDVESQPTPNRIGVDSVVHGAGPQEEAPHGDDMASGGTALEGGMRSQRSQQRKGPGTGRLNRWESGNRGGMVNSGLGSGPGRPDSGKESAGDIDGEGVGDQAQPGAHGNGQDFVARGGGSADRARQIGAAADRRMARSQEGDMGWVERPVSWEHVVMGTDGNRTRLLPMGHRFAADLVLWAIHQASWSNALLPLDTDPRIHAYKDKLPPPIAPGNEGNYEPICPRQLLKTFAQP